LITTQISTSITLKDEKIIPRVKMKLPMESA
jgi:hypothetical protein